MENRIAYTPEFEEVINSLSISLVLSTYNANCIFCIGKENGSISFRRIPSFRPMGLNKDNSSDLIAVSCFAGIFFYSRVTSKLSNRNIYIPKHTVYTGFKDGHQLEIEEEKVRLVSSTDSSSYLIDIFNRKEKIEKWTPSFIFSPNSSDQCHLNGLASSKEHIYYTALGKTEKKEEWKREKNKKGILIEVERESLKERIVSSSLSLPHSPVVYKEHLYYLESGKGILNRSSLNKMREKEEVGFFPGFVRGLCIVKDIAFVCISKLREKDNIFTKLPIEERGISLSNTCSICAVDLNTGKGKGYLNIYNYLEEKETTEKEELEKEGTITEIFDILPLQGELPYFALPGEELTGLHFFSTP